jgi:hypothetical protein
MTMRDRWERLKKNVEENQAVKKVSGHVSRNKRAYAVGGGTALAIAIFEVGRHFGHVSAVNTALVEGGTQNAALNAGRDIINPTINNTTNNITTNNIGNDALSYITREVGTDNYWLSQAAAARDAGVDPSTFSKHINHGRSLPGDRVFERIGIHS